MQPGESGQMYLETIYVLSQSGKPVHSLSVAEHMGFSKPSVSRAVGILKKNGYLIMDKDGALILTQEGRRIGEKIYDRHTTLTAFLIKLGVSPETAAQDACKMEHDISDTSFDAIKSHVFKNYNKNE